jgi:thioredoxin-related protein
MTADRMNPASCSPLRRSLLGAGATMLWPWRAQAAEVTLPAAQDLPAHLKAALQRHEPLVVMVSLPGCPFCKVVRESHLAPMQRERGLPVVQVDMQSRQSVRDFAGASSSHDRLIEAWRVRIAPTVLFFGRHGEEVVKRLVGGYLPDFYGSYLDERLEAARKVLA